MILHLDRQPHDAVAAIDSSGHILKYSELLSFSEEINSLLPERSLLFLLTENNVGGIAWSIGSINSGNVPLILNAHTEQGLYHNLFDLYRPAFLCVPSSQVATFTYETVMERYGYTLLRTGMDACPLYEELSHLLPTSGSTGSPKLVRHKYSNIEAAALNISTFFGLTEADRPLLVLPLYYTMGLSVVFSHLYVGATILITNLSMTDRNFWDFMKGQKQLLCIARVMLCLPPMLILDEATSSIDTRTEVRIQKAFARMMQGRTSFIVAHRLSTIREADVILVMKDGHIVEQGNHDQLLAQGGFYAKLYNSQFEGVQT